MKLSPESGNGRIGFQQDLGGHLAQGTDDPGADDGQLAFEKRQALLDLAGLRVAVAGRTALDHIANINHFPGKMHGPDDFAQQLAGGPHKGVPGSIFIKPGSFAHEHQPGVRRPLPEHDMGS